MSKSLFLAFIISFKMFAQPIITGKNPDNFIESATLSSAGMDSNVIYSMTQAIEGKDYPNIHSVLIVKQNKLLYEHYFPGEDEILGDPIGVVEHSVNTLHDMRSVSKSVVGACIGIAIAQGKIKNEDQLLSDFFPEYKELFVLKKEGLTVKHLMSMSTGLEWNENIPYNDSANFEIRMEKSPDPVRFVLEQRLVDVPGKVFNYNGGNTEVLAAIIYKTTGMEVDDFFQEIPVAAVRSYKV